MDSHLFSFQEGHGDPTHWILTTAQSIRRRAHTGQRFPPSFQRKHSQAKQNLCLFSCRQIKKDSMSQRFRSNPGDSRGPDSPLALMIQNENFILVSSGNLTKYWGLIIVQGSHSQALDTSLHEMFSRQLCLTNIFFLLKDVANI